MEWTDFKPRAIVWHIFPSEEDRGTVETIGDLGSHGPSSRPSSVRTRELMVCESMWGSVSNLGKSSVPSVNSEIRAISARPVTGLTQGEGAGLQAVS